MIRTIWVFIVGVTWTALYGVHMIVATRFGFKNALCVCDHHPRAWARRILRAARCPVTVAGAEYLDADAPQILVSNHESWFDVFTLAAYLPGRYRFVAKKELSSVPIFGRAFQACGHVSVDRGDRGAAVETLELAARQIRSDSSSIVMFPEGTRTRTGELQRFKKGAFVLAIQAGVPVVPVAILGSRAIMPKGAWTVKPGQIEVRIGEPIEVDGLVHNDRDALLHRARDAVAELRGGIAPTSPA